MSGQVTEPAKRESYSLSPKGSDQDTNMQNEQRSGRKWLQGAGTANRCSMPPRMQLESQTTELEHHGSLTCMVDMEPQTENEWNKDQLGILMHQNEKLNRELDDLNRERREDIQQIIQLKQLNEMLARERDEVRRALKKQATASNDDLREASNCSQSKLEAVMKDRNASVEQLQQAIRAVEALVKEARRKCVTEQLREDPGKKPKDEKQKRRHEFLNFITRWKPCPASPSLALRQQTALYKSCVAVIPYTLGSSWQRGFCAEFDELDQGYLYWA